MPVRIVQSKQNARLKELRRAFSRAGADGLAAIEGPHLLEEALRAGLRVTTIFLRAGEEEVGALGSADGGPIEIETLFVPAKIFDSVVETETPQRVAALVQMPSWTWADALTGKNGAAPLLVILAGIQDPGNLGTILRSAEAFGATGVVSLPGTVHAWNAKAVRASAGSVFRLPLIAASAEACFAQLRAEKVTVWATAARGAGPRNLVHVDRAHLERPSALLIGNEGNGISPELATQADGALTIPCPGPVESLNAAVAASVLLYEASRQRSSLDSHPFSNAASGAEGWMGHGERIGHGQGGAKKSARSR
jgi:RNA methyltransferase, TrmH family